MQVNYTTYDLRRDQDVVNLTNHPDVMVLAKEDEQEQDEQENKPHPFWYARVVGIFHATVKHLGPKSRSEAPQEMEFLFVRWFGRDPSAKFGWEAKRLPRIGFIPYPNEDCFGFLDPALVIRSVHLIPAFSEGQTNELLPPSIARHGSQTNQDWKHFYVNM
jgi:hypothetical protein